MTTSNVVTIIDPNTKKEVSYFIEPWVKKKFDEKIIPDLHERDKDCVIAIDGTEGSGKSTLGLQFCKYIDPSFNLSQVVFTPDSFREAVYKAKKGQAIMFDEAFTGFSSRAGLSGVNKTLISLMMQVRQKNLFIVIVLPTFFLLDKYISLFRARVLVHVYQNKSRRGFFRVYSSKKKRLLILDKASRTYSYAIRSKKKGRFYGVFALGDKKEEKKYRDIKMKALQDTEKNPMSANQVKHKEQRDLMLWILRKELKMPYRKMQNLLDEYDFDVSYRQIATICSKFGDKEVLDDEEQQEKDNNQIKPPKKKEKEAFEEKSDDFEEILEENVETL
jgi:hypothetical protein